MSHGATTGTVTDVTDGVATVALDDGSGVQAAKKATGAPAVAVGQRVLMARSGDTWIVVDTFGAVV